MSDPVFRDLRPLLRPRSIAVVGASPRRNRGTRVIENLRRFGFSGEIHAVNPKYDEVLGAPCVPSVSALPDGVDLVVVAVGADAALTAVRDAGERGVRAVVLIGSGFGEGSAGSERAAELRRLLDRYDMVACGPNCYGTADLSEGAAAYSGRIVDPLPKGNVALVLQSGALSHAVTDSAMGRGLGASALITTGNEVSATVSDYVAWYAEDESTDVIGVFLEGLRDAPKFAEACRRARARGKAVVVVSGGRSDLGRQAAMAHTGAVSGAAAALDGLLASVGAIRVNDLDEFRETVLLFSHLRRTGVGETGVGVLSISGGASGLVADAAETCGLSLPAFDRDATERLSGILPDFAGVNNPLDVTGSAVEDPSILLRSLQVTAEQPGIGMVVFAMNVGLAGPGQEELYRAQAKILAEVAAGTETPLVLLTMTAGPLDPVIQATLEQAGVPVVMGLRPGILALKSWLEWPRFTLTDRPAVEPAGKWPSPYAVASGSDALEALEAAGVPVAPFGVASGVDEVAAVVERVGLPVVLKVESPDIAHKTEVGGVRLGLATAEEAEAAAAAMLESVRGHAPDARITGILVQRMVRGEALECLMGVVDDPQVGLVLSIAPGGILAELMGPAPSRPVPLAAADVEELLDAGVLGRLLAGYRGAPALDRAALVEVAVRFSALAASLPGLAAAEMNPLLVLPEGQGVTAVDCLLINDQAG
ncbi:acetate--CoA ligase family protein [Microbispora sp. H11081]|uniref:acetate--CoA ligase family protein n=1 Tax=Microbispora sp. H11081 TaxID=2729107 RepID=UPI001475742B|nr:acetate--CoA ligase family protein [Microbispora sp. H11081]